MKNIYFLIGFLVFGSSCKHDSLIEAKPEAIDCSSGEVDFVNQVLPILQTSCATSGCHDAETAKGDVILDNYTNIIKTGEVNAGNANSSELYEVLNETGSDLMPPASTGVTLSQTQKDLIKDWINQGAKNVYCSNPQAVCDSIDVSYSNNIVPILDQHCVTCHSGSTAEGTVWLDNYNDVKMAADSGKLLGSIIHDPQYVAMPEGSAKLNDCKIATIKNWILEGTLNN